MVIEGPVKKQNKWGYVKSFFTMKGTKPKEPDEKEGEEDAEVLATRFISFDEGCFLVLQYLPHKPIRNYGLFAPKE